TSGSSRWSTGLGQGCVGQKTHASIRSPASRAKRRRETGRIQGKSPPASLRVIPPPLRTLGSPSDRDRHAATLHSTGEASSIGDRTPDRTRTNAEPCHPCHATRAEELVGAVAKRSDVRLESQHRQYPTSEVGSTPPA